MVIPTDPFESLPPNPKRRVSAPAARNREPILAVLQRVFPPRGSVLEAASGTGEHAVYFASKMPGLAWQPTDVDLDNLESINAWIEATQVGNVRLPTRLDLGARPEAGGEPAYHAGFCANLIHIAPWAVCGHLFEVMSLELRPDSPLVLYGPYKVNGCHTSDSNAKFEQWLWSLSPEYGVRDVERVIAEAERWGHLWVETVPMPANNFCLVFRRS